MVLNVMCYFFETRCIFYYFASFASNVRTDECSIYNVNYSTLGEDLLANCHLQNRIANIPLQYTSQSNLVKTCLY